MCYQAHRVWLSLEEAANTEKYRKTVFNILGGKTPDHLSLVLSVGRLCGELWEMASNVFRKYPGLPGHGTPQKIFILLQGLKDTEKMDSLKMALDKGIQFAVETVEKKKKVSLLKGHFLNVTGLGTWQEAMQLYGESVSEEVFEKYTSLKVTRNTCPRLLLDFCQKLKQKGTIHGELDIDVNIKLIHKSKELRSQEAENIIKKYKIKIMKEIATKGAILLEKETEQDANIREEESDLRDMTGEAALPENGDEDSCSLAEDVEVVPSSQNSNISQEVDLAMPEAKRRRGSQKLLFNYLSHLK